MSRLLSGVACMLVLYACEQEKDKYYERPDWLEGTIYQQLQSAGRYTVFLKCLDLTGYGEILNRGGSYTVFAPTDDAFASWLHIHNRASVAEIPVDTLREMVEFHLLNYAFSRELLVEWSSFSNQWRHDARSFKKRTLLKRYSREKEKLLASDYKYVPLFTDEYFDFRNGFIVGVHYDEECYTYFYPTIPWEGMNLADARFTELEIPAENGFYYGIDKVLEPGMNLEEILQNRPEYSEFLRLACRFVEYEENVAESEAIGSSEPVYKKHYRLVADLCTDNLLNSDYTAFNMLALAAPDNGTLQEYYTNKLLAGGYENVNDVPDITLKYVLNSHLKPAASNASYYPVDMKLETGPFGSLNYNDPASVACRQFGSNGIFYGIKTVLQDPVLNSVASSLFYKPEYRIFLTMMEKSGNLSLMGLDKYTIVAVSDDVFFSEGFSWNSDSTELLHHEQVFSNDSVRMLVNRHVFAGYCDASLQGGSYGRALDGYYVAFQDGKLKGDKQEFILSGKIEEVNGVFYTSPVLLPVVTQATLENQLKHTACSAFKTLMDKTGYTVTELVADATANEHIILVPSNEAVNAEIQAGHIPSGVFSSEDKVRMKKIIRNHIIPVDLMFTTRETDIRSYATMEGNSVSIGNTTGQSLEVVYKNVVTRTSPDCPDCVNRLAAGNWVLHSIEKMLID